MSEKHTAVTPESLPPVIWNHTKVITTERLASLYGADPVRVQQNFIRNTKHFKEGKHYFKVKGDDLRSLRLSFSESQISPKARSLILWTERGAMRHAKVLETDKAWEVFETLEDCYFHRHETEPTDDDEPSTVKDREPALVSTVGLVVTFRLSFPKAYMALNHYAGSEHFRLMSKRQAKDAAGFAERLLCGQATQADFKRMASNQEAIEGESPQMQLIDITIPLLYGNKKAA